MAQKSGELEQYLQRVRELEGMYGQLKEALEDERQAKQDEEAVRKLQARSVTLTGTRTQPQASSRLRLHGSELNPRRVLACRLLEEAAAKRDELEQMHRRQQRTPTRNEAEKQEQVAKETELQAAELQLEQLEKERQGALEQYKVG